ncbi:putative transcriptional regulator, TetR family protein [Microlunatus endophyticus]|uniref:Transcriptional regulator, TetR family protein n=1 Tax=Microlunatus endophyticus TaxID=1716077 RepID=A0A917W783_9ACTN|nr:putative transcriptional regulator, TetR family protein [Microlunatus endophyticus]
MRTAVELIDQYGTTQLSMRNLGQQLGVEAMSLYRYVRGREDLLEAIVAGMLHDVETSLEEGITEHWQGYLQTLAHRMRDIALEHPQAFPLVATRHPATPWLRPPLRSLELVESFIGTLCGYGFTDEQIAETYRAFSSFLLGQLLLESAVRGAETSPVEEPLDEGGATVPNADENVDLSEKPNITRMQSLLSEDRGLDEFETSLENLLDRLDLMLSQ